LAVVMSTEREKDVKDWDRQANAGIGWIFEHDAESVTQRIYTEASDEPQPVYLLLDWLQENYGRPSIQAQTLTFVSFINSPNLSLTSTKDDVESWLAGYRKTWKFLSSFPFCPVNEIGLLAILLPKLDERFFNTFPSLLSSRDKIVTLRDGDLGSRLPPPGRKGTSPA
jgi:hypothetical protein